MLGIPHPDPTGPVCDDLWVVREGMVDFYVVRVETGLFVVDTGIHPEHTASEMARLGLDPASVSHVFFTHSDFDHTGGLAAFPDTASLFIGRGEIPLLEGRMARSLGIVKNKPLPRPPTWVDDGFTLEVGGRTVLALAMPGHTPGSTAYLVDNRWLFVGDACTLNGGRASPVPWFLYMDRPRAWGSLRRVATLKGVKRLCTAHSGVVSDFAAAMRKVKQASA